MTRLEDRQILVRDIEQACADGARLALACALAGIDTRTLRRWKTGDGSTEHSSPGGSVARPVVARNWRERSVQSAYVARISSSVRG